MNFDEYQTNALRTAVKHSDTTVSLTNAALGLAGEAGEFAELIKKHVFHKHELDKDKAVKELGDVLWYLAFAANELGVPLKEIAEINIQKLKTRYEKGFTPEASIERKDLK